MNSRRGISDAEQPSLESAGTPEARRRQNARAGARQGKEKPTIRAVAARAGVAVSTVSRVVNGGSASRGARARVLEAIAELGYKPSIAAQRLVNRRSGSIGLAVNSTQSPWFSEILLGIEEALAPSRMSVLLASLMLTGRYDSAIVSEWIADGRVDGLILVRYSRRDEPLLTAATKAGIPTVLIAPDVSAPAEFTVRCNNTDGGRLAAGHLLSLGHRRIAFAGGPKESIDTRDRLQGLVEGLAEHEGLTPRDVWFGARYSAEAGEEYAERYLDQPKRSRPTAVVLGNDSMAIGFMRRVLARGVQVPDDVAVIGFDGTSDGAHFWPGVTSVVQPTRVMAARACGALLDAIAGSEEEHVVSLEYGVELLIRESTGPHSHRVKAPRRTEAAAG
jgi:DNA-binding LacI/PurR family transcriptional regulator